METKKRGKMKGERKRAMEEGRETDCTREMGAEGE